MILSAPAARRRRGWRTVERFAPSGIAFGPESVIERAAAPNSRIDPNAWFSTPKDLISAIRVLFTSVLPYPAPFVE